MSGCRKRIRAPGNGIDRAFTVIELLVVISLLAILVSLLLPALAAARVEGVKAKCVSNLRVLAQTAQEYSNEDPLSTLGPVHKQAYAFTGEGYAEYGGGPGTSPYVGWDEAFDPVTRPFNAMIYGPDGIPTGRSEFDDTSIEPGTRGVFDAFMCPGEDFGYQDWPGWGGGQNVPNEVEIPYFKTNGTSYRMNNLVYQDYQLGGTIFVGGIYGRPVNRIPDTSQTISFMEARAFQTLWTNDNWGLLAVRGELTGWHKKLGYFSLAFSDGHAAYADMGNGTYFPQVKPRGHFDVRGTWGRMDCLSDKPLADPYRNPNPGPRPPRPGRP